MTLALLRAFAAKRAHHSSLLADKKETRRRFSVLNSLSDSHFTHCTRDCLGVDTPLDDLVGDHLVARFAQVCHGTLLQIWL